MPKVNRIYKGKAKSYIQSVRFLKDGWSKKEAHDWCVKHDFYVDGLDETPNKYRYRQYDPDYDKFTYLKFKENLPKGIYFIMGYLK